MAAEMGKDVEGSARRDMMAGWSGCSCIREQQSKTRAAYENKGEGDPTTASTASLIYFKG
jgi:hypothetical protein